MEVKNRDYVDLLLKSFSSNCPDAVESRKNALSAIVEGHFSAIIAQFSQVGFPISEVVDWSVEEVKMEKEEKVQEEEGGAPLNKKRKMRVRASQIHNPKEVKRVKDALFSLEGVKKKSGE